MNQPTQALEHASVKQYCKALRVPVIGANFVRLAEQAVKEQRSHIGYLEALLAMEIGRTRPARHSAAAARCQAAPAEDAGRVRLQSGAADSGGEDPRTGRRRLHRARRTGGVHGRVRHGQDASGDGLVRGRVPAEAAGAIHHRCELGERAGRSPATQRA